MTTLGQSAHRVTVGAKQLNLRLGDLLASHFMGDYAKAISERQPQMYIRLGVGTLKGICKTGALFWSSVFVQDGQLDADIGRGGRCEPPHLLCVASHYFARAHSHPLVSSHSSIADCQRSRGIRKKPCCPFSNRRASTGTPARRNAS